MISNIFIYKFVSRNTSIISQFTHVYANERKTSFEFILEQDSLYLSKKKMKSSSWVRIQADAVRVHLRLTLGRYSDKRFHPRHATIFQREKRGNASADSFIIISRTSSNITKEIAATHIVKLDNGQCRLFNIQSWVYKVS